MGMGKDGIPPLFSIPSVDGDDDGMVIEFMLLLLLILAGISSENSTRWDVERAGIEIIGRSGINGRCVDDDDEIGLWIWACGSAGVVVAGVVDVDVASDVL